MAAAGVFVCEDNNYAISVDKENSTAIGSNADRGPAYGMPGVAVTKNDAVEVFKAAGEAVARARSGDGPTLIEVKIDRYLGHFQGDPEIYRPKGEVDALRKTDPIPGLAGVLRAHGLLDDAKAKALCDGVHARVTKAFDFARQSPYPEPREAFEHVFAGGRRSARPDESRRRDMTTAARKLTMAQAIAEAIEQEMERDPSVFVMGEDVGKMGGIFGATGGLLKKFGPDRVIDTPISETAIIGAAIGAAAEGLRPIAELMFVDFIGVCIEQINNEIAKTTYMSGGTVRLPWW